MFARFCPTEYVVKPPSMVTIDVGLLTLSTIILCTSLLLSYVDLSNLFNSQCSTSPNTTVLAISDAIDVVNAAIFSSQTRVLIAADGSNITYMLPSLTNATSRGIPISVIMPRDSEHLRRIGVSNITIANISFGFVVVDDNAYIFSGVFPDNLQRLTALTQISECACAVDDVVGFFNFQFLRINNLVPSVVPINMHARTSLIKPLKLGTNGSLYFFHNPVEVGDPLRIATSTFLAQSLYINANENPMANISLYVDDVPAPNKGVDPSLFTVLKRILIKVSKDTGEANDIYIRLLLPSRGNTTDAQRWIKSISAFRNADVRLYDNVYEGVNFIEVGGRIFLFSHTLNDGSDTTPIGFHMSSNNTEIVSSLVSFWNSVWDVSVPFGNC